MATSLSKLNLILNLQYTEYGQVSRPDTYFLLHVGLQTIIIIIIIIIIINEND